MDDKEKLKFLQRMGYSITRLTCDDEPSKKEKRNNRIDKEDLLALGRVFDVLPQKKKQESLSDFLKKEEESAHQ